MPVETLRPADSGLRGAPFRLLNKGPEYFRRQNDPSRRSLSAVERLEADKAKYVKSQQVALTRQAPIIRKALLPPALICPAPRRVHSPTARQVPHCQRQSPATARTTSTGRRGPALDLEVLNNLINDVCDGSGSSSSPSSGAQSVGSSVENQPNDRHNLRTTDRLSHLCSPRTRPPQVPPRPPLAVLSAACVPPAAVAPVAVRRVDVRPQADVKTPQRRPAPPSPGLPSPPPYLPRSMVPPASPAFTRLSNASSRGSARKHPTLHRSKSDLSDRFSRASADLERFFNLCGLDPEELPGLGGAQGFARANSDIVSKLRSVSAPSSDGEDDPADGEHEETVSERVPYGISIIERNARVIKWLYGIRQAREGAANANV